MKKILIFAVIFIFALHNTTFAQGDNIKKTIEYVLPSLVSVMAGNSYGSGVIVNTDGYILTNYHVIEESLQYSYSISIKCNSGKVINNAKVLDYDDDLDLALIKTTSLDTEIACIISDPDSIYQGQDVICIGNPLGLENYVTNGIISKYNTPYLFTNADINPGNSGGILIDNQGRLVGIPTMTIGGTQNINIAICPRSIRYFLDKNGVGYEE
jgi:S1-C subfamily serine protease